MGEERVMSSPIQLQLLDLVNKEKLERILRVFTEVTGVASIIANVEGRPITRPHNFTPFCLDYCRSTDKGRSKCHESDRHGGLESARSRKPYIYNCLNSGLIDCAAPVIVEGYHLATILAGQVFEEPIATEVAVERAKAIGIINIRGYLEALGKVPLMTRERLLAVVNLMSEITQTISELALQKYLLHRHSQHYLSRLINSVSDCILSTNTDGRITIVNQAGAKMFGYETEHLVGESIRMLFAEDDSRIPHWRNPDSRSSLNQRSELTAICSEGQTFPVQVSFSAINEAGHQNAGHVWVIRDISEEKRLERMKEDLVGMITHDMRNPVLSLQKVLQLILNDTLGPLNLKQKNVMQLALATCHQLFGMVSDILDIYRNESGQFVLHWTPVSIDQIILESLSQLDLFAKEKGISLQFETPSFPLKVLGDQKRLRRVLVNLLENAIKYGPEDSIVQVEANMLNGGWARPGKSGNNSPDLPSMQAGRDCLMLTFTDHGIGIPAEYHQCIFDKYFTIKSSSESRREGVGLGLAFCKQVIEAHGGDLWVESPILSDAAGHRQGCRFHLTLPVNLVEPTS
jgi:PAS domain S-box-containing protein